MLIDYNLQDSIALARLNRPEKLNALTGPSKRQLTEIFRNLPPATRAVILTGAGRAFCAGTDIAELKNLDEAGAKALSLEGQEMCAAIENCGVPVIAAVNGIAAGGGCELALACHLRVAAEDARFSLPETRLGLLPAYGGTQRLTRAAGKGNALAMMLTGNDLTAQDALRLGLVSRVAPAENLEETATALAREIAGLAPLALRACLQAVLFGQDLPLAAGLQLEAQLFSQLFATADAREGTQAFLEKRAPRFRGC
jgi:enoyl-CoA hydratase